MKKYKEFLITAEPFNTELLSSILWELDITGINEDDNSLQVFAEVEGRLDTGKILEQLKKLQAENLISTFNVVESVIEDKNWNEEWGKSLKVIRVSDKIVIKPSSKGYEKKKDEIVITIDPKMSFGTGEHQTTRLVLQLLEKYVKRGMKVLDAGTGTGILSITAVKLGASSVIGFDPDEWCFENARENCDVNNVSDKIEIRIGDIGTVKENEFDMILANIQKDVLLELCNEFSKKLKRGGLILLSGLLEDDEQEVVSEYNFQGFQHMETRHLDEWIAVSFVKT